MSKKFETPGKSSPRGSRRGCLCKDNTYSTKCCDQTLRAQGIGSTYGTPSERVDFLTQEDTYLILQENNQKILI